MKARFCVLRRGDGRAAVIDLVEKRLGRLRCRVFGWAKVIQQVQQQQGVQLAMIGLSYDRRGTLGEARSWRKGDVREFTRRLRERMGPCLLAAAWVLEIHASGDPHYHVLVVYRGRLPWPDKAEVYNGRQYHRLWPHGLTHVDFKVRTVYYLAKYTGKAYQKDFLKFPEGAHAWHVWVGEEGMADLLRLLTSRPVRAPELDPQKQWHYAGSTGTEVEAARLAEWPPWQDRFGWLDWRQHETRQGLSLAG